MKKAAITLATLLVLSMAGNIYLFTQQQSTAAALATTQTQLAENNAALDAVQTQLAENKAALDAANTKQTDLSAEVQALKQQIADQKKQQQATLTQKVGEDGLWDFGGTGGTSTPTPEAPANKPTTPPIKPTTPPQQPSGGSMTREEIIQALKDQGVNTGIGIGSDINPADEGALQAN